MPDKQTLRKHIKAQIAALSTKQRNELSEKIMKELEGNPKFRAAKTVMLYYSLPDEVCTHDLIARWAERKCILLPVVKGDEIEVRRFTTFSNISEGAFHIGEPQGDIFTELEKIELIVVPGVAFDRQGNRMGRGRGYYDRFLSQKALSQAWRIGLCFPQQLVECVPAEPHDISMHEVLCQAAHPVTTPCPQRHSLCRKQTVLLKKSTDS